MSQAYQWWTFFARLVWDDLCMVIHVTKIYAVMEVIWTLTSIWSVIILVTVGWHWLVASMPNQFGHGIDNIIVDLLFCGQTSELLFNQLLVVIYSLAAFWALGHFKLVNVVPFTCISIAQADYVMLHVDLFCSTRNCLFIKWSDSLWAAELFWEGGVLNLFQCAQSMCLALVSE